MKNLLLIIKVKMFINSPDSTKYISYDWDCDHSYSYISHSIMDEVKDSGNEELESMLYTWLYENDECPPCCILVNNDGTGSSSCGCHDNLSPDEVKDVVRRLEYFCEVNNRSTKYIITKE